MLVSPTRIVKKPFEFKQGTLDKLTSRNRYFSYFHRFFIGDTQLSLAHQSKEYIVTDGSKVTGYLIRGEYFNTLEVY